MAENNVKIFKRSDIKKNDDNKRVRVIIHNNVYDVTDFLNEHPGGEEVLLEQGGEDATEAFEDVAHSLDARNLMNKYKIGELDESIEEEASTSTGNVTYNLKNIGEGLRVANELCDFFLNIDPSMERSIVFKRQIANATAAYQSELKKLLKTAKQEKSEKVKTQEKIMKDWADKKDEHGSWKSWTIPVVLAVLATLVYRFYFHHNI